MLIAILVFATMLTIAWLLLLGRVTGEDWVTAAYSKVFINTTAMDNLRTKEAAKREKLSGYSGIIKTVMTVLLKSDPDKKTAKLEHDNLQLQQGDLGSLNILVMPGYVLQREFEAIGKGNIHKKILTNSYELYGKKRAAFETKHLMAKLLSYPIIGVAATLMLGSLLIGTGNADIGIAVLGIGSVLVLVLVYAMYDELSDKVKKRRIAIGKQFPNVVSKLALLVTSGMIMDRAWKETAYSQDTELYIEMQKTSEELENLVSPEAAYSSFINRCNTKETAKLASAIMQNLSKGNSEIGRLLKDMAREAWQERRHTAKRDAEKANSKLMIPTMLLFLAILVMLMVPVAMNFSGI